MLLYAPLSAWLGCERLIKYLRLSVDVCEKDYVSVPILAL